MDINTNNVIIMYLLHTILIVFTTVKFASGKSENLRLVGWYSLLLCTFFFPASWIYCALWSFKRYEKKEEY